jgi:collagenase-like PrtC family protease
MELVLASNFDDRLVERTRELPISTFFGGFPVSLTGGGRPPQVLPPVDTERFRAHLVTVHRYGRVFYATLNSNDLGLHEYEPGYVDRLIREVGRLLDLGVDGFVVGLPAVLEAIRSAWPDVPVTVSTFARIRTVTQAEYFRRLGVRTVVLEEANRDFRLIRGLVRRGMEVEILVNQTCLPSCPYRAHHLNTSSLASQPGAPVPMFEYPILECGLEYVRDPARLVSGVFVRPEDLDVYEEAGVHRFKVSGRNRSTDWLIRSVSAYAERHYAGDLTDIVSLVQLKGPLAALERLAGGPAEEETAPMREAFRALRELSIDNSAFPEGFLRHVAAVDCEHTSCDACGYCRGVAERVLRIGGRPPSEYRAPSVPTGIRVLPRLGPEPPCEELLAP